MKLKYCAVVFIDPTKHNFQIRNVRLNYILKEQYVAYMYIHCALTQKTGCLQRLIISLVVRRLPIVNWRCNSRFDFDHESDREKTDPAETEESSQKNQLRMGHILMKREHQPNPPLLRGARELKRLRTV